MQKYLTIYHDLRDKIKQGYWKNDDMLPSEHDLTEQYVTSRETIRKALDVLVQNGYIQKVRGKGSIVIRSNKVDFPVSGIQSFKELAETMNLNTTTKLEELSLQKPTQLLKDKLQPDEQEKIWRVFRIRHIEGENVILDKDYLRQKIVPKLTEEICRDSIYDYIEKSLKLMISFAHKEIVVEEATEEDYRLLDMDGHRNIVVIRSIVYLDDAQPFQYTESRHRPDKFRFVDFARRVPNT